MSSSCQGHFLYVTSPKVTIVCELFLFNPFTDGLLCKNIAMTNTPDMEFSWEDTPCCWLCHLALTCHHINCLSDPYLFNKI